VHFSNPRIGWAVGGFAHKHLRLGTILATSDGGTSWRAQKAGAIEFLGVHSPDGRTAWVVGVDGAILQSEPPGCLPPR
jgi:hypothetical protein